MTLEAPPRCSALSEELDESMVGSAPVARRWLLVEDRGLWGSDAVRDLIGPDAAASAKEEGLKVLLVRRRERDPSRDGARRVMLVDPATREAAERSVDDLADLSVAAAARLPVREWGASTDGPLFLVCTNGKRDACCALRGRALMAALADRFGDRTWECSHLGGHRFAANLVCMPDGIVYGRVSAADGPRLARDYEEGLLDLDHLRGRSAWPAPAQGAEVTVRQRRGIRGVGEVELVSVVVAGEAGPDGETATVVLRVLGEEQSVTLRRVVAEPARITSCRGDELETPVTWVVVD